MNYRALALVAFSVLILAGCATQPAPVPGGTPTPPGLLLGLVHGFIALFTLIISLFSDVRVYAYPNAGFWYDLGFVIGAAFFFGGGSISVKFRR